MQDKINNQNKEQCFRFPERKVTGYGRKLSCLEYQGKLWTAVQIEKNGKNTILILGRNGNVTVARILATGALCHQPFLIIDENREMGVLWNEFDKHQWKIRYAVIDEKRAGFRNFQTIAVSSALFLPPAAVCFNHELWVSWPAMDGDRIRIQAARRNAGRWSLLGAVSAPGADAFRPVMAAGVNSLSVIWDQYRNCRYEISGKILRKGTWRHLQPASKPGERWFCPDAAVTGTGEVYLTWVVLREVSDDSETADHLPFAMAGKIKRNRIQYLSDPDNFREPRMIADLREGLLPSRIYKGYLGLRRNPRLSVSAKGHLWCFWEVRMEAEATALTGHLAGRRLKADLSWSAPCLLENSGYGYAIPKVFSGNSLPVAFFRFGRKGFDFIVNKTLNPGRNRPYLINPERWRKWHDSRIEPLRKLREPIRVGNKKFALFWADTHCHSNFSADAEGEPDEIIHFGRDLAGLDALCLMDNDYYPNKTLSPAEWQIHQELSRHFTANGKFVLFAGYEFTYHRRDLDPDFNHRCVIYPGPGGKMYRRIDPESDSDRKLLAKLKKTNALCYPHHCSYEIIDPALDRNVEICSSWRVSMEESDFTIKQLESGKMFGFIGSSDAHRANPGLGGALTGVYAEALTPESLFEAYKNRRTVATQGFAVYIDFRAGNLFVGEKGKIAGNPVLTAVVKAPDKIAFVQIIRDGEIIFRKRPRGRKCRFSFTDHSAEKGAHFYFLKLKLVGEPGFNTDPAENSKEPFSAHGPYPHNMARARGVFAWTSPVWVKVM